MNHTRKIGRITSGDWGRRNTAGVVIASSLAFRNVSHRYGDRETLHGIDLEIAPREVISLLGPSGSGKTTLLRLAAGLLAPTSGEIVVDGRAVSSPDSVLPPERRGIGLVFQDFALFPHLTILQNVGFGLTRLSRVERDEYALRMLERVGLTDAAALYPHHLSGGEQQRVALARALAPKPGILLMDEPFSGLDARLRESVREETLSVLRDTRSTVVVVTHDPEEALKISDRIALMENGRLVQTGTCGELYNHPNSYFAARFFSELNVFEAEIRENFVVTPIGRFETRLTRLADSASDTGRLAFRACVRPSDFSIVPAGTGLDRRTGDIAAQGIAGLVRSRRFVGEAELIEVLIPGNEQLVHVKTALGDLPEGITEILLAPKVDRILFYPT